jgi:acetyl esterase/lipase
MGDDAGHPAADAARYLLLRTSHETARVPDRCRRWARTANAEVEVAGPFGPRELRGRLGAGGCAGAVLELAPVRHDTTVAAAIARAGFPVVAVSRDELAGGRSVVEAACARVISGRGSGGFLWALSHLRAVHEHPPRTLSYGPHPAHVGDLRVPESWSSGGTAVALVHGGFWRHEWERDLMDGVALDLTRRGYATWNVEYRRVGPTGGGWPQTRDDVLRAVTALPMLTDDRVDRMVLLGHSAGAQLALRAAAQLRARGRPPTLVVSLSGLFDLQAAAETGVGWGSVEAFMGGALEQAPAAYRDAAPIAHVPVGVPQLLAHGTADEHVPPAQSETYRRRASAAGDDVEFLSLQGADHFAAIDATTDAWATTVALMARLLSA